MKAHAVRFTARAERDLGKLPEKVASACVAFVFGPLSQDPDKLGKPLVGEFAGTYSARRGPYRVLYEIDDEEIVIELLHIDHRAHVYRR
ncbi:type II toxin-antitoxin system RelE family toxin [Amycolatopsis pithecellobii]|uniref:Type II toxin-antitoxin system RelE/ParE family toxin n=1 Tax=Amycolatopsis pithecellobii TaxID=664692 RepID=A0A6N7YY98_9PSEU|nr:type II toxin-antitoxin system RelE/ParE family toxin [Amycolatopsis pithecellobii]MTD58067.1 type II toxin-antitoxin system RelE/ParE family toxin [Amycolatopsis pithecellobii]